MFVGKSASKRAQAPGIDRTFTRVGAGAETGGGRGDVDPDGKYGQEATLILIDFFFWKKPAEESKVRS